MEEVDEAEDSAVSPSEGPSVYRISAPPALWRPLWRKLLEQG